MHWSFFLFDGHGVVIEGNRKMSGCLRTFGGHCIIILYIYINKNVVYNLYAAFFALVFKDDMVVISTAADIYMLMHFCSSANLFVQLGA